LGTISRSQLGKSLTHHYTRRKNNLGVKVVITLIMPMLLISMGSFGYALLNDSINTIAELDAADYHIEVTNCIVKAYNGFGLYQFFWDPTTVSFNDSNIFPGWELILNITIHNTADSWICKVNYTIFYWNETSSTWKPTDENGLLNLFKLEYETKFYNATGELIVGDPELLPDQSVFNIERLKFVANPQEFEELLGRTFDIQIEIYGTYPDPDPLEGAA